MKIECCDDDEGFEPQMLNGWYRVRDTDGGIVAFFHAEADAELFVGLVRTPKSSDRLGEECHGYDLEGNPVSEGAA